MVISDMKVTLRYTDLIGDGKNVFLILSRKNIKILKTRHGSGVNHTITICIDNYTELNELLGELNRSCGYEVSVVKVHRL